MVTRTDESSDAAVRERVLDAAIAELATSSVGSFTMAAVARGAGIELRLVVKDRWANSHGLLPAALMSYAAKNMPMPNTGSLREDLLGYAKSFAASVNSPIGRRLLEAIIATPKDWDVSGWRSSSLAGRRERAAPVLRRAIERGDCHRTSIRYESWTSSQLHCSVAAVLRPAGDR